MAKTCEGRFQRSRIRLSRGYFMAPGVYRALKSKLQKKNPAKSTPNAQTGAEGCCTIASASYLWQTQPLVFHLYLCTFPSHLPEAFSRPANPDRQISFGIRVNTTSVSLPRSSIHCTQLALHGSGPPTEKCFMCCTLQSCFRPASVTASLHRCRRNLRTLEKSINTQIVSCVSVPELPWMQPFGEYCLETEIWIKICLHSFLTMIGCIDTGPNAARSSTVKMIYLQWCN